MTDPTPAAAPVTVATPAEKPKRPPRPKTAPKLPDVDATKDDWENFRDEYAGWVEKATDADLLAEMAALPEDGRPLSPAEAWMYHQCEVRRRRPTSGKKGSSR